MIKIIRRGMPKRAGVGAVPCGRPIFVVSIQSNTKEMIKKHSEALGIKIEMVGKRHFIRLEGYDFSQAGAYFVTICTHHQACLFGEIVDREMHLNDAGRMVQVVWDQLVHRFDAVHLDE